MIFHECPIHRTFLEVVSRKSKQPWLKNAQNCLVARLMTEPDLILMLIASDSFGRHSLNTLTPCSVWTQAMASIRSGRSGDVGGAVFKLVTTSSKELRSHWMTHMHAFIYMGHPTTVRRPHPRGVRDPEI
jgi:hypothetical protein